MTLTAARQDERSEVAGFDAHLEEFFERKQRRAESLGGRYSELWRAARRSSQGGKKIRPALVINTHSALGGGHERDALNTAVAFELLHTAFLLHDDVIDGDTVRRGEPNLVGAFHAQASELGVGEAPANAWAEASAILAGDLLIHSAGAIVARLTVGAEQRSALLDLFDESVFVTAAGELADVAFATTVEVPALAQVLAMTQWKTAHYSFQAPLVAGAILADASEETIQALSEFGRLVGIAFQLRDDLLGVFGSSATTGKSTISDLREAKVTPLIVYARQTGFAGELASIVSGARLTESDAERVRLILEQCGAREVVETLTADYARTARGILDSSALPESLRRYLRGVALKAGSRTR
jgi:geranylgeranyl diphosphate synthase type II